MEFIIDSADTAAIRKCIEFFPVAGVTTNPTIISKEKADFKLSMGPMTFPHHLARIMVLEQLYRAEAIQAGSKYHK